MIPYFTNPLEHVLPAPFNDSWGVLVCVGFIVGLEIARARAIRIGLDVRDVIDGIMAIVGGGFVVGHLVHVLAYHPEQLEEKGPIVLVQVWAGLSSFGGFVGAIVGGLVFYKLLRPRPWLLHSEAILYGFPVGWLFGRLGCFSAHDHIGRRTDFFLAVDFPGGARHDLGLYEAILAAFIAIVFAVAGRKPRHVGFFVATWCFLYAPARFGFDFLRNTDLGSADVRWASLTPAQWGCLLMLGAGVWAWRWSLGQPKVGGGVTWAAATAGDAGPGEPTQA